MDYLYDKTQYFTINEEQETGISKLGKSDANNCSIFSKSDYTSNTDLYLKIAQAIQFGTADEHTILLLETETSKMVQLSNHIAKTTKLVICFGLTPDQLGLAVQIVKNRVYRTETYHFIFTDALEDMNRDTEKKKAFWTSIQTHIKQ